MRALIVSAASFAVAQRSLAELPPDWLLTKYADWPAPSVTTGPCGDLLPGAPDTPCVVLGNGLLRRTFAADGTRGLFGTVALTGVESQARGSLPAEALRAFGAEAQLAVSVDAGSGQGAGAAAPLRAVGGLVASTPSAPSTPKHRAYLNRSALAAEPLEPESSWRFAGYEAAAETPAWPEGLTYTAMRGAPNTPWPPQGACLKAHFASPAGAPELANVKVTINYCLFRGIPLLAKWITMTNLGAARVAIHQANVEVLSLNRDFAAECCSSGSDSVPNRSPLLDVFPDVPHGAQASWSRDQLYTDATDAGAAEPVLVVTYTAGPGARLEQNATFTSFRSLLLMHEDADVQRQSLARLRVPRLLAPWTNEAPLFLHLTDVSEPAFMKAVEQCSTVGFDMIIMSFGSQFDMEDNSTQVLESYGALFAHAKQHGIEVAGYDLIDLQRGKGGYGKFVGDSLAAVGSDGQLLPDACFASSWVDVLRSYVEVWLDKGLTGVELDGPYGGGECHATTHTHHHSAEDAIFEQDRQQRLFMTWLRNRGVFINQPDNYFYYGGSKTGMGYNEDQYSLPRWEDLSVSRAAMYDDTFVRTPTMGWMQLPLVDYHGGGGAAQFEPLSDNQRAYNFALGQYILYGVAVCYRGLELYDSDATRALVTHWVTVYKQHREILVSDIVHIRRPDGQNLDAIAHVNPALREKALVAVFNPTDHLVDSVVDVDLYYTGLPRGGGAKLTSDTAPERFVTLGGRSGYVASIPVSMAPQSVFYVVVTQPGDGPELVSSPMLLQ